MAGFCFSIVLEADVAELPFLQELPSSRLLTPRSTCQGDVFAACTVGARRVTTRQDTGSAAPVHILPGIPVDVREPEGRPLVLPLSISAVRQFCSHSVRTKSRVYVTDVHLRAEVAFTLIPNCF